MADENTPSGRENVAMSNKTISTVLLALMLLPLLIIVFMGAWFVLIRAFVALSFGICAYIFANKADKYDAENDPEKALKNAKNAKAMNIIQLIYGIFSWIAFLRIIFEF